MATLAKGGEIAQAIRFLPIALEYPPGDDVVNIKRPVLGLRSYATFLTGILVALACGLALLAPVWATPLFMAALPIAVILALLPDSRAVIRTEAARILAAFDDVGTDFNRLSTDLAGEQAVAALLAAFPRACALARIRDNNRKRLIADRAGLGDAVTTRKVRTRIRTKAIPAALLPGERLAANLTNRAGQSDGLPIAGARTKPLRWAVHGFDRLAALFTFVHVKEYSTFWPVCQIEVGGGIRT